MPSENSRFRAFLVRWWPMLAFAAAWLALRVLWITCDTGVPATWEYGFHTTDEGYYLCGGKEMFLWGSFVDLTRQEALNYCYSYGTHWLSYLAHLCFGLSTWSWRIPFVLLYFIAWMMMFRHVARRSGGVFAFATCLALSSVPLVVTYERGASNDATIAALVAIAFCLAAGRGCWRIFAAAVVTSAIGTVKPAVWVMMPIVLSALLEERKTRSRWIDAGAFVVITAVMAYAWKGLSALTVLGVARTNGMTPWEVLSHVNATYGLPSILDLANDFRALASFPRDPAVRTMGPTILFVSVVPAAMLLTNLVRRKWNGHLLLYLMVPLYAYALNVINSMYTHYFLPLLILVPAVASAMREDFAELHEEAVDWKRLGLILGFLVAAVALAVFMISSASFSAREAAPLYSRIHNLPQSNPWRLTGALLVFGTLLGVALVAAFRGVRSFCRESWLWLIVFFLGMSIVFAALPAAVLAPHIKLRAEDFYWPIAVNMGVSVLFAFVLFVRPAALARPLFVLLVFVTPVVASYALLPSWRAAGWQLLSHRGHYDAALAAELGKLLPKDAVLLGERSDQALMSLPIRAVSTFLTASNPVPYAERLLKKDPKTPIYALIDPQCPYNLQHFREHEKEYSLALVKSFKMPSTGSGELSEIHLCRVIPRQ